MDSSITKVFGERLRELREEQELSRAQLGAKVGFTGASVGRWESALQIPNIETLTAFADYFHCSADFLLGRADS